MEQAFFHLAPMGIYADWLVLAVLALRLLLKKAPKRILCLLWALVALRLMVPVQISWKASLMPPQETVEQTVKALPIFYYDGEHAASDPSETGAESTIVHDPVFVLIRLWAAGMTAMLGWTLLSTLHLRRRLRASIRAEDNVWICDEIDTPFVLGLFSPKIYLPSGMDEAQCVYVLAHERAHIARGDHWWKLLGWLLLSVYWFHPLLWLAYILLCRDLELACDERAVRDLDRNGRAAYSQALLDCSRQSRGPLLFPVAFGEVGVKPRVQAVLNYKKPAFWLVLVGLLAVIAAGLFFLTNRPGDNYETYFERYRIAVIGGDKEAAAELRWFENDTKRQMYLDNFQRPNVFAVTDRSQINDSLWAFTCREQLPEMPDNVIYQFVGREYGRFWIYPNVNQIPDSISDGLDRSLYDYHEDENVMFSDEDEQLRAMIEADERALIEAFPDADGAESERICALLAEYYLSDPEGVTALINQYTLTEQQKQDLLSGVQSEASAANPRE